MRKSSLFGLCAGIIILLAACDSSVVPPVPPAAVSRMPLAADNSCLDSLQAGDILLRTGNDGISDVFRYLNTRNQTYSHAGIVVIEHGQANVYHSIGGADNPAECLRCDPATAFVSPLHNLGYAVIRYKLDSAQLQKVIDLARQYYIARIRFDTNFDLLSDDKMYCTEFVWKVLRQAAADTGYIGTTSKDGSRYVAVDDLFNNKHSQTICELRYK